MKVFCNKCFKWWEEFSVEHLFRNAETNGNVDENNEPVCKYCGSDDIDY